MIEVLGGELTKADSVAHLNTLVPGKHGWDVKVHAPNIWVTAIPPIGEVKRTINFCSADLKNGMALKFQEFVEEQYFGEDLTWVWLKVISLSKVFRTYIWGPLGNCTV
jgi:hypothetical protein